MIWEKALPFYSKIIDPVKTSKFLGKAKHLPFAIDFQQWSFSGFVSRANESWMSKPTNKWITAPKFPSELDKMEVEVNFAFWNQKSKLKVDKFMFTLFVLIVIWQNYQTLTKVISYSDVSNSFWKQLNWTQTIELL